MSIYYLLIQGSRRAKLFNPKLGMDALVVTPSVKRRLVSEQGVRVEQVQENAILSTQSKLSKTEMLSTNIPEIQRTNHRVLQLKAMGISDLLGFYRLWTHPQWRH
jgi:hypothetical protein